MSAYTGGNSVPVRRNGLARPFHPFQIATWFLFAMVIVHYYAFLMPLLWDSIACKVIVTFFFSLWTLIAGYGAYETCRVNPADDAVCQLLAAAKSESAGNITPAEALAMETNTGCACCYRPPADPEQKINCYYCKVQVHSSSKHCIHCNKCVLRFDHHCKWLNTCVGQKNYNYFLTTVFAIVFKTSLSLALSLAYLVESFAYADRMKVRGAGLIIPLAGIQGISVASVALLCPLVGMVYQLAGFHITLSFDGITTYEYIVRESNRDRRPPQQPPAPSLRVKKSKDKSPASYEMTETGGGIDGDDVELSSI